MSLYTLGLPDDFVDHASRENLLHTVGLSPEEIAATTIEILTGKHVAHQHILR